MVEGILRYPVTVKAHALWHLCCRAFRLNPRAVWCYMFEEFMGRVAQCASRSVAGTATQGIGRKVVENYRLVAALRFGRSICFFKKKCVCDHVYSFYSIISNIIILVLLYNIMLLFL